MKEQWRSLKRNGGDNLALIGSSVEECCVRVNNGRTLAEIYKDSSLRSDLVDKYVQIIREDDHAERRHFARQLADYAEEILTQVGTAADLNPTPENLERCTLRHVAAVYLQPREDALAKTAKQRYRSKEPSSWRTRWDDEPPPRHQERHHHSEDRSHRARGHDRSRVAYLHDQGGGADSEEEDTSLAFVNSSQDKRPVKPTYNKTTTDKDRPEKPKYLFLDYKKLLDMKTLEARQAWPADASFSKVADNFITRPIDRNNQIWPEDACLHCVHYRKLPGDHHPLKCPKLREFIQSKASLKHLLTEEDPRPPRTTAPFKAGGGGNNANHKPRKNDTRVYVLQEDEYSSASDQSEEIMGGGTPSWTEFRNRPRKSSMEDHEAALYTLTSEEPSDTMLGTLATWEPSARTSTAGSGRRVTPLQPLESLANIAAQAARVEEPPPTWHTPLRFIPTWEETKPDEPHRMIYLPLVSGPDGHCLVLGVMDTTGRWNCLEVYVKAVGDELDMVVKEAIEEHLHMPPDTPRRLLQKSTSSRIYLPRQDPPVAIYAFSTRRRHMGTWE